jgi:NAD(P)-dependent dehydrogenase (short-subunit alcohol dehydrogenase family)
VRALDDKIAIVTGGGGGIGGAIAQRFSREGAKVAVVDIDGAAPAHCAHQIGPDGAPCLLQPTVTKKQAVKRDRHGDSKLLGPC